MSCPFDAHIVSMEGMDMGISVNNHLSFSLNSGIKMVGASHGKSTDTKSAGVKHNSQNIKSNSESLVSDSLTGGVVRNKAATVDLSKEGKNLARKLKESKIEELKEQSSETRNSLEKVNILNGKLRSGENLSDEDRDFINEELKKLSSQNYVEKRFHVMTKEDYEGVMGALQEHMIQRIQLYSDLQKELEAQKDSDEVGRNAQKIAEAEQEQSQKKRIIEILDETLKEDDEEKNTDTNDGEVAASEPSSEQNDSGIIQFENEEKTVKSQEELLKFRAIDLIDKNKEQLEGMFSQSASESDAVREADRLMDAELIRSYDLLTNNDLTEEDKLKEFNNSWDYMHELHYNKMIDQAMSKLDFDTWLISKIEFNSHNNLHEVIKDDNIDNPMGGIDMVRDFLTNANPF